MTPSSDQTATAPPARASDGLTFLVGGVLVFIVTRVAVPRLAAAGLDPFLAWMLLSVPCVFVPIIACGWLILRSEPRTQHWAERLRLRRLSREDWRPAALGVAAILAASAGLARVCDVLGLSIDPFAREPRAWLPDRPWMFALWALYWPINILGEEFVWRGVILPRMQARFQARAWRWNAVLWALFHTGFGIGNILVVSPSLLLVPWLTQRRRNTWVGVILHVGISLPGMLAIALGLV